MQQLTTFLHVFINSISQPKYYQKVLAVKSWFSWKYFLLLNALLSLVTLVYLLPALLQFQPSMVADEAVSVFPAELVVYGDEEGLSINQERPYSVPFPEFLTDETSVGINLVTFSTDEEVASVQDFYNSQSLAVVTETTIYMLDDTETGEVRVYAMPTFTEPFEVSQADVESVAQKIIQHPFFAQKWYVPLVSIIALVLVFTFSLIGRIIALVIFSAVAWVITAVFMKAKKLSYGQLFQIGLHSLTLPLLVKIIIDYFMWFDFSGIIFMIAYLVWTLFIVSQMGQSSSGRPAASTAKPGVKTVAKARSAKSTKAAKPTKRKR